MLNSALLAGQQPLGIALSGGSDSTALLVLAADLIGAKNLSAITINHGLRPAAAQEAARAHVLCNALGVPHETVTLALKDGADLQARARAARYQALAQYAQDKNLAAIALGHTQDDVAETFLMRLARGSGVDGLAQMPARFVRHDTVFLRPLLNATHAEMQQHLRARALSWSEDPSNADPRFTRVQMRQAQPDFDRLGLTTKRLAQTADWMRAASEVLEQAADKWIEKYAACEHGDAVFELTALNTAAEETAGRVLSRAFCNISGNPYRPRLSALNALRHLKTATTLHGCLAYVHKDRLRITQELNAITPHNNRWHISGPLKANQHVAPLGEKGLELCKDWRETALLPRRSLLSSPAIWHEGTLVAAPLVQPTSEWQATAPDPLHFSK